MSFSSLLERAIARHGHDELLRGLSGPEREKLVYEWQILARAEQLPPDGDWRILAILAGRGSGKTRTGAEWVRWLVETGKARHIALVAETAADARDVMVEEGESSILKISPPWFRPKYEPSKRRLTWPNGAVAITYSAEDPEQLRGPAHDAAWCLEADTPVLFADGTEKSICRCVQGDFVMTRDGPSEILAVSRIRAQPIWQLTTESGRKLCGTGDHPIFADGLFKPLYAVCPGSILLECKKPSSFKGSDIGTMDATTFAIRADNFCTESCGKISEGPFRRRTWSIMPTETCLIIESRTSSSCQELNICGFMGRVDGRLGQKSNARKILDVTGRKRNPRNRYANGARAPILLPAPEADGVARNALELHATTAKRVVPLPRRAPVFNLEVANGEYFADGILVHNCDEIAKWARAREAWDNLMLGLRVVGPDGSQPRCLVTTTPRPTPLIVELVKGLRQPDGSYVPRQDVAVVRGSTYDNRANLAPGFLAEVLERYEGTRLGRQEIGGELLEDVEGALWTLTIIDDGRVVEAPDLDQIVVGVDPAITATEQSNETGIVVAGCTETDFYVFDDATCRLSPDGWARAAVTAYHRYEADRIIAEANQGGDMVRHTIHTVDRDVPVILVHASRGKRTRAEPIAALYEQGRVHHVGSFPMLEDQMSSWVPGEKSPDRVDALCWAITGLMQRHEPGRVGIRVIG